ncbi:hypothetical protein SK128_005603 [Halocaridina rubra]|uniref:Uncharacterized protein n=1 Tax=Halocaridina rubra TaxID=373956 RepID=A0AAN8XBW9_HALRR
MGWYPSTSIRLVMLISLGYIWQCSLAQHLENDLQSLLNDIDVNNHANPLEGDDDFEVELFYKPDDDISDGKSSGKTAPLPSPVARGSNAVGVRRLWGVADTQTPVGRLFSYPIPDDAFEGDIVKYQVSIVRARKSCCWIKALVENSSRK